MEQIEKKKICDQPGCKILEGGTCLEGIDVTTSECPHLILREVPQSDSQTKPFVPKKKIAVQLFSGRELTQSEISIVTDIYDNRMIVIVGESESGKSTFLAEFFINLQKGAFCKYLFAGSLTQIGFEERAFHATLASGNRTPKTERTKSKEFYFLHLMLKHRDRMTDSASHLLFSDISGERFRDAKTSTIQMRELKILRSADFILFLIDGEKLANLTTRSLTIEDAKTFIQKAIDENIFDKKTLLKVAITKWDVLDCETSFDWRAKIEQPFGQRFRELLGSLEFAQIASRSDNLKVPPAFGICQLLDDWLNHELSEEFVLKSVTQNSNRIFHRYTYPT